MKQQQHVRSKASISTSWRFTLLHGRSSCPGVEVLAEYTLTPEEAAAQQHKSVIVAVRDSHLMATAFHPELTQVGREG